MSTRTEEAGAGIAPLMTADEVAAWLNCSKDTVYRFCRESGLPHIRQSKRSIRFERAEVAAWLQAHRTVIHPPVEDSPAPVNIRVGFSPTSTDWSAAIKAQRARAVRPK